MFSLFGRKPKPAAEIGQGPEAQAAPAKRRRQQNIKVSEDCALAFAALADAHGITKAALFEDMVAERWEIARSQGLKVKSFF